jgi:hypothetical protein
LVTVKSGTTQLNLRRKVDHRTDVEELELYLFVPQVDHVPSGRSDLGADGIGVQLSTNLPRPLTSPSADP